MNKLIRAIENDVQDRTSEAWKKLCDYVERAAAEGHEVFSPGKELGAELFSQIHTLPESISKLKTVKKLYLYGSRLIRLPPEIGDMDALEEFTPYTSYDLNWFPYEITRCKNLKDSTVSTRAIYGNHKNRMGFPSLAKNPVRYEGETLHCSICKKVISYGETEQLWITLRVATDWLPLLTNLCSETCEQALPRAAKAFVPYPHKGGADLQQPGEKEFENEYVTSWRFDSSIQKWVSSRGEISDTL
jgi:hypothetical protein